MLFNRANIRRLRQTKGLSVRDLQQFFGFEEPQAIYKWQRGQSLPTVDNLYALSALLDVPMNDILVAANTPQFNICTMSGRLESAAHPFDSRARWALLGLPLDEVGQDHVKAVVHLEGKGVVHRSVDQALV